MSDIQKFLENSLNFQRYDRHSWHVVFFMNTTVYRSKIIPDPRVIGIYHRGDIYDRVKLLLYYSVSEHISTKYEGHRYFDRSFDIRIFTVSEGGVPSDYKKLMRVDVEPGFDVQPGFIIEQLDSFDDYSCPIQIDINANGCYHFEK